MSAVNDNFNALGFGIIGLFILAWAASLIIYRYKGLDRIEVRSADTRV